MGLSNMMREAESRTLAGQRLKGIVVDNEDPLKLNRVKIRSHLLHRNIPDDKLPWFTPATQHTSNSGSNNQGKHGPIPPKGTEIWFTFRDDSQYFGEYYGAPVHKKTAVNEFAKAEKPNTAAGQGGQGGSLGSTLGGAFSSMGGIGSALSGITGAVGMLSGGLRAGISIPGLGGISASAGLGGISISGGLSLPGIGSIRVGGSAGAGGVRGGASAVFGAVNVVAGAGSIVSRVASGSAVVSNVAGGAGSAMSQIASMSGQIGGALQTVTGLANTMKSLGSIANLAGGIGGLGNIGALAGQIGGLAKGLSGMLGGLSGKIGGMLGGALKAPGGAGASASAQEDYSQDYPHVDGDVNPSGSRTAKNHKRDTEEDTHVSGTSTQIDGKGNVEVIVNGDAQTQNESAKKKFPKGRSIHVHGDWTVFVSGGAKVHSGGDAEVVAKGKAYVHAGGDVDVAAGGNIKLSGNTIELVGSRIHLCAPIIRSQVPIERPVSGSKSSPKSPSAPKKANTRQRPEVKAPENDTSY